MPGTNQVLKSRNHQKILKRVLQLWELGKIQLFYGTLKSLQIRTDLSFFIAAIMGAAQKECFTDEMISSCWSLSNSTST